jgi:N-acetyl-anhydromuramyl-L-alanine amidase AmpD
MAFSAPSTPLYTNTHRQPIYWIDGANVGSREGILPDFLVMHHTAGTDSRKYLWKNPKGVSTHYLIGIYPDAGPVPRIYKYATEGSQFTFTQGFSRIGPDEDPNNRCISIEMEGPPVHQFVIDEAAKLAGSILRYWANKGRHLLLIGHRHIDLNGKLDPAVDWSHFCQRVYHYF